MDAVKVNARDAHDLDILKLLLLMLKDITPTHDSKLQLNYKEWKAGERASFQIVKSFTTEWLPSEQLQLSLEGQSMDALYEAMAGQVTGFGTSS